MKKIIATLLFPALILFVFFKLMIRTVPSTTNTNEGLQGLGDASLDSGFRTIQIGDAIVSTMGRMVPDTLGIPGAIADQFTDGVVKPIDLGTLAGSVVLENRKILDPIFGNPVVSATDVVNPANTTASEPKSATPIDVTAVAPVVSSRSNEIIFKKTSSRMIPTIASSGGGAGAGATQSRGIR